MIPELFLIIRITDPSKTILMLAWTFLASLLRHLKMNLERDAMRMILSTGSMINSSNTWTKGYKISTGSSITSENRRIFSASMVKNWSLSLSVILLIPSLPESWIKKVDRALLSLRRTSARREMFWKSRRPKPQAQEVIDSPVWMPRTCNHSVRYLSKSKDMAERTTVWWMTAFIVWISKLIQRMIQMRYTISTTTKLSQKVLVSTQDSYCSRVTYYKK